MKNADTTAVNGDHIISSKRDSATLNEQEIISIIKETLVNSQLAQSHFPNDDVGYGTLHTRSIVVNTDTLVQSTDMPPHMTLRQASKKSVVSCISDFVAKGVQPKFATISVNMPKYITRQDVQNVAQGFADATFEYGIQIIAGDTNAGKEFVFNVCLIGSHKDVIRRGGANVGDKIFVTGPFGYTALGLEMLLTDGTKRVDEQSRNSPNNHNNHNNHNNNNHHHNDHNNKTIVAQDKDDNSTIKNYAIKSVLEPSVHLKFMTSCISYVTSSMDSSDGLAATLNEMSRQSECVFEIHTIPTTQQLLEYVYQCKKDLRKLVFYGGEEYETVFTIHPHNVNDVIKLAHKLNTPIIEIGQVVKKVHPQNIETTNKVYIIDDTGCKSVIKNYGWDHFNPTC